jgi:hypothetical protein
MFSLVFLVTGRAGDMGAVIETVVAIGRFGGISGSSPPGLHVATDVVRRVGGGRRAIWV